MSPLRVAFALAALLATASSWAEAPIDGSWHWFRSTYNGNGWFQTNGDGTITSSNQTVHAELFDGASPALDRHILSGSFSKNELHVRVEDRHTDSGPYELSGRLVRTCNVGGGGFDFIVLSNGYVVLALQRALAKSAPCSPAP